MAPKKKSSLLASYDFQSPPAAASNVQPPASIGATSPSEMEMFGALPAGEKQRRNISAFLNLAAMLAPLGEGALAKPGLQMAPKPELPMPVEAPGSGALGPPANDALWNPTPMPHTFEPGHWPGGELMPPSEPGASGPASGVGARDETFFPGHTLDANFDPNLPHAERLPQIQAWIKSELEKRFPAFTNLKPDMPAALPRASSISSGASTIDLTPPLTSEDSALVAQRRSNPMPLSQASMQTPTQPPTQAPMRAASFESYAPRAPSAPNMESTTFMRAPTPLPASAPAPLATPPAAPAMPTPPASLPSFQTRLPPPDWSQQWGPAGGAWGATTAVAKALKMRKKTSDQ